MSAKWANSLFCWTTFDVGEFLPDNWHIQLEEISARYAKSKELIPTSITSREDPGVSCVSVKTVGGVCLADSAPWLYSLYQNSFRVLAQRVAGRSIYCAEDKRIAINLNIQSGAGSRYEAHVDSNPLEGLLYVTTHPAGTGGQLVVGLRPDLCGVDAIKRYSAMIYPIRGHLVFFDARINPHYVESLLSDDDCRIVVAMNYYTDDCTESDRPADLNYHLGLDE